MRRFLSAAGVLGSTLAFLAVLVHFNPFDAVCVAMDKVFGAPPDWLKIINVYNDPRTQETTRGDDPVSSLAILKDYWHARAGAERIIFVGNSQMHSISLASGENPSSTPEKTYVDQVFDEIHDSNPNELAYRLSTSGMSYPEALWEISYVMDDPDLRPDKVLLQMNYQFFWTGGIRDSMLPMLRRPSFRGRIEALANSGRPDAPVFADALLRYALAEAKENPKSDAAPDSGLISAFNTQITPGNGIETATRELLEKVSPEQHRADLKESFEQVLYRGRLYLLRMKPSTARSITGFRLSAARSAVDSIATLCTTNRVRLVLFHAPVNPNVSLYRTQEDSEAYHQFVSEIAKNYQLPLFDFEHSISAEHWGYMLNTPEPLHMGRIAHQQMAKLILQALNSTDLKN